ncbi:MAG: lysophospholipid acyltransferase family protein [Burkholderiaceae bacterium]|nr:lysophospholipid acyltransferase family protein [Burkholderiaceae bacterium]
MLIRLFRLLSFLPLPLMHAAGVVLGWLVYLGSADYRKRMKENLALAGYSGHLAAAVSEAGKGALELPFVWCAPIERVLAKAEMENWEIVDETLAAGQSILFLTPHLGCFEILALAISQRISLTALYRPPRKEVLRPLMETARGRGQLLLAPANLSGVRTLLKTLKSGRSIGLLPDQVPQEGEGVWADFYGKPAYTMTLPAKMHQMTGARMLLSYAERLRWGRGFKLRFVPFEEKLEGTPEQQATAVNREMERLITACPAQYFWSYNRYKKPAGAAPRPGETE